MQLLKKEGVEVLSHPLTMLSHVVRGPSGEVMQRLCCQFSQRTSEEESEG